MINKQSYQITGMRQDNLVGTGTSNKFAHEIVNMRFNTIGDYTTASWTTEKGTKHIDVMPMYISGSDTYAWLTNAEVTSFQPIGQANINDEWVLFGIISNDSVILNLHYENETLYGRILYRGNLGFNAEYPIETVTFYENEMLQKVYWTDGLNQPRVINIKGVEGIINGYPSNITTQFDFTQEVSLNERVDITKDQSGAGLFPPGTVKYALSYYHKYGQETNIVYDSPLYYPTLGERACSPEELSGDSFYIKVTNLDLTHGFDYIRLYSIVRTTDNATPVVRIVEDKPIKNLVPDDNNRISVTFHDTNTTGRIIDPSIIQFIGGREIIAHTFDQKNNTLFLGNIELKSKSATKVLENVMDSIVANAQPDDEHFHFDNNVREDLGIRKVSNDWSVYQWINQLNQTPVYNQGSGTYRTKSANSQYTKHFKFRETYRFGVQFQDSKGAWSEVLYLNDLTNNTKPYTDEWNMECQFAGAQYTLPSDAVNALANNGYKKARLVCCYPTNADREIVAQGVVAPTVYNNEWRNSHTPDVMSSWFFRPNDKDISDRSKFQTRVLPWKDNQPLDVAWWAYQETAAEKDYDVYMINPEVQSTYHRNAGGQSDIDLPSWENDKSVYKVCRKVLTFHSPEIELDESLRTMPSDSWEVVVIGKVPINSYAAKYYVEAGETFTCYSGDKGNGLQHQLSSKYVTTSGDSPQYGSHITDLGEWHDMNLYTELGKMKDPECFCLYPFQRKGSLNNYVRDLPEWKCREYWASNHTGAVTFAITKSSELQSKCLSHILYSTTALFEDYEAKILSDTDNATFSIFDSSEVLPLKLKTNKITGSSVYDGEDFIYYGNVNNISPISDESIDSTLVGYNNKNNYQASGAYPLAFYKNIGSGQVRFDTLGVYAIDSDGNTTKKAQGVYTSDPVPITYKSTTHGVFFSSTFGNELNFTNIAMNRPIGHGEPGSSFTPISTETITGPLTKMPFLYLAEVRRKVDKNTRFGGKPTIANPVDNIYVPCGPAVNLTQNNNAVLKALEGDTYYMRYDNLKTYPFATNDTNQIVEILSFMVETRINLDGRYDKNRGLLDNTMINNTNFGLINKYYTQTNNTFTFMTLDKMSAELDNFANQITWTTEKVNGEDTDAWTNITLASTADADGTLGSVTRILNFNDRLLMFQDHGLAQINYNENTAISTESGVPLELAKTGKFTGFNYFTREIGCQNKWSISKSKNGLFWIDDSRQELLTYDESIKPLSTINGFDAFMIKSLPVTFKAWNPANYDNFVTYYDKLSNDVYYINKDNCLAWNEQTGTFTSFYNYENVPYMMNVGQHSLMWKGGVWAAREADNYSVFFGQNKDYSMTLVCDGITDKGSAFPADKVFNNIEYRSDIYNLDGTNTNYNKSVFNKKQAWNGYQNSQEVTLDGERKFNTWRVQLPRHYGTRDRIRNPFCYIKLKQDQSVNAQTDRMILHDLAVYFDMR